MADTILIRSFFPRGMNAITPIPIIGNQIIKLRIFSILSPIQTFKVKMIEGSSI